MQCWPPPAAALILYLLPFMLLLQPGIWMRGSYVKRPNNFPSLFRIIERAVYDLFLLVYYNLNLYIYRIFVFPMYTSLGEAVASQSVQK